jgi:hypothetical protein
MIQHTLPRMLKPLTLPNLPSSPFASLLRDLLPPLRFRLHGDDPNLPMAAVMARRSDCLSPVPKPGYAKRQVSKDSMTGRVSGRIPLV